MQGEKHFKVNLSLLTDLYYMKKEAFIRNNETDDPIHNENLRKFGYMENTYYVKQYGVDYPIHINEYRWLRDMCYLDSNDVLV